MYFARLVTTGTVYKLVFCSKFQYPELLAASYGENSASDVDPDGVALIWNTKFAKDTPEYIFQCQSRVTKAKFAK